MELQQILADIKSDRVKKVILDTDTFNEIDDQYSLAYCYFSKKIELLSVEAAPFYNNNSTGYEDGMLKSYAEIKKVLALCDREYKTPVFEGSRTTVEKSGEAVGSPAAQNIIDTVKSADEPIYVLAIGAITNVASALLLEPSIKDNMVVIWLGANDLDGNNLGEFNLVQDYTAGQILINSGVPLVLCPAWNTVSVLTTDRPLTLELCGKNKICDYLFEITDAAWKYAGSNPGWVRTIWDIAAPAILDNPGCAEIEIIPAPVMTDSRVFAFDSTRHKIMLLKSINREAVFERTWEVLTGHRD